MLPLRMLGLLMLLFLHGADGTSCPLEVNPLIWHPYLGEYGSTVVVNCSSKIWQHEGITLSAGNCSIAAKDNGISVNCLVELRDWKTKVECKVKLNDSTECVAEAEIIAYKNPEVVLSVEKIDKTHYRLKCDVTDFAPAQNLTVTWYRDDEILTTNVSAEPTAEVANASFTLEVNINRTEEVVPFRCQAQLDLGLTPPAPVISQTHNVSALYAPELRTKDSHTITVSMGENVTLICDVEGNPPPDFQWTVDGKNLTENTRQLKINEAKKSAIYTCTATNDLGNKPMEIYVHVMEVTTSAAPVATATLEAQTQAPQDCLLVLTPPEITVRFGDPVEINCTSNMPEMGWEAEVGNKRLQNVTTLTWEVEKLETWAIEPICYAPLKNRPHCTVTPVITVYQTPDVSISAVDQELMTEGKEYRLKCDINNVAPVQLKVKWYHGNKILYTNDIQKNITTPTNVSRYYTVIPKRGYNGSVFRCEAELQLGPKELKFLPPVSSNLFTAVVHYKPLFKDFPSHYSVLEGNFTLSELPCKTDGNPPPPAINWYFRGAPANPHEPLQRNESGYYTAEAGNIIGTTSTSVRITVEYGPSLTCEETYEEEENNEIENPCQLDGSPPPTITWFKHGKERIFSTRWTKHDSGMYTLIATNTHGAVQRKFHLQVLYAPEFVDGDKPTTMTITPGENVSFNCCANGYSIPKLDWEYSRSANVTVTTEERCSIISITGATSFSAGDYKCVATNKVGTVRRSFTLILVQTDSPPGWGFPVAIAAGVLGLIGLIFLVVLLYNYIRKQGKYSFVENTDTSHIPMIPQSAEAKA